MNERRRRVRTGCAALLIWLSAAAVAGAEGRSKEFWPEIDAWPRVSSVWRVSVSVPISKNLVTHYREGNLILHLFFHVGRLP